MNVEGARRVKFFGILGITVVLLISFSVLAIGGSQDAPAGHGAGHEMPAGGAAEHGGDHARPTGGHHGIPDNTSEGKRGPVTWTVEVKDNAFAHDNLTIQIGDTVTWVHVGSNPHTVTAKDGTFDSHPDGNTIVDGPLGRCMSTDGTSTRTFEKVGDVAYQCKLHKDENMAASVHIQESYNRTPDASHH